jgi:diaminohydroxyphosphoribosylaminopyrimidine deaminase/5-amino-6-(5-phosphoribosylamino)uracil reductase
LFDRSPVRVVLARSLAMPPDAKLVRTATRVPLWIVTSPDASATRRAELIAGGAGIIDAAVVGGNLWLPSVMEALVARGITRLLVEGGPRDWRAFADAALDDEVVLYMAESPSDAQALDAVARWLGTVELHPVERHALGNDTMWWLRRDAAKEGRE